MEARARELPKTTICLSMIVKNEAHVIERCLRSVRPLLSSWVIVDTGSTDDTEAVVRRALEGIPGEFVRRPWVDFAHNRNEALSLSRPKAEYSLIVDADDELELPPGYRLPELYMDVYFLRVLGTEAPFVRPHFVHTASNARYEGVVHEILEIEPHATTAVLEDVIYRVHLNEGGRSLQGLHEKFVRDSEALEAAVRANPDDAKNTFFLAQTHEAAKNYPRAIELYEKYAKMAPDDDVKGFIALLRVANMRGEQGAPMPEMVGAYLRAHARCPWRAEALHALAVYFRSIDEVGLAHAFASAAMAIPRPTGEGAYLLREDVHAFGVLEEYSSAAWRLGFVTQSQDADRRLIEGGLAPPAVVAAARSRLGLPPADPRWRESPPFPERLGTSLACEDLPLRLA